MTQKIDKEWTFICDIWNVADILVLFALSTKKQLNFMLEIEVQFQWSSRVTI